MIGNGVMYANGTVTVTIESQGLTHGHLSATTNIATGKKEVVKEVSVPAGTFFQVQTNAGASEALYAYASGNFAPSFDKTSVTAAQLGELQKRFPSAKVRTKTTSIMKITVGK